MEESQFNKFKEDKLRALLVLERGIATTSRGNYAASQLIVVKCYNCLGEGHMTKHCTQPKRTRISEWFKEKLMLAKALEAAFQTEDLDAYDSDCDDISSAKAVLMANLSSCDLDVLSKVPYSDTCLNDKINQEESQDAGIQDTNSSAPNDLLVLYLVEQMTNHVANLDKENQTNKMVNESLTAELERYKEQQAFWLKHSNYNPKTSVKSYTPVRIEAPSELPKSQEKDMVIIKLKDRNKSLSGKDTVENVKKDIDEIETINIELDHSVAKLLSENKNLRK
ncbi:integrase, catalytic region, zinc finger, CCHC-type containing protein [Tanacetum coccineum]|uniref:Integrase, catalytic region, zinc finger, CCHC-type containing protein n=1 Tax=Tanacetum coccineum TaxID=301880 RepID=A0ABQ5E3B4_9ASTR